MEQANTSMLLVGVEPELEGRLVAAVKGLTVNRATAELRAVAEAVAMHKPQAAIVGVEANKEKSDKTFQLVTQLAHGGTPVIVVGPTKDADLILRAMRAGAQEFLVADEDQQLAKAVQSKLRAGAEPAAGKVITAFAAKGGVGSSAIVANLAGALARHQERVCVVDLDLHFGDMLSMLDVQGTYAITDLAANMARLDRDLLDATMVRHPSGIAVLSQSDKIEEAERIRAKDAGAFIGFLKRHYGQVLLDGVRGFDELSLSALDASDLILLIVTQDVPSVRNAQRSIELFRRLGYEDSKLKLVVNRYHKVARISPAILAETIGLPVAATLANDFAALSQSIDRGVLLADAAPRSPLVRDLELLAAQLRDPRPEEAAGRRSFFAKLFRRG